MRFLLLLVVFLLPLSTHAQELYGELQETVRAEVVRITDVRRVEVAGTDVQVAVQTIEARLQSGDAQGDIVRFENDLMVLSVGDKIFVNRIQDIDGNASVEFKDFDRWPVLLVLLFVFVALFLFFAGKQGLRALLSLAGSIAVLFFILVPLMLAGYSPVLVTLVVAGVVLALVIFVTHGTGAYAVIAFIGTFGAVAVTSVIAAVSVHLARFNGFGNDAAVYLNISTQGALDMGAILLAGIIIGMLGVLDDVAITQASVTEELKRANKSYGFTELYRAALRVGRDHMSSLVNTLAFAYIGVSLPLVLLLAKSEATLGLTISQEIVADEIVRIIVGSIGLILAVPLTTLIAAYWYANHEPKGVCVHTHTH